MKGSSTGPSLPGLAGWSAVVAVVAIAELLLHVLGVMDYQRLVVDAAELSDEVGAMDGAATTIGVVLLSSATAVAAFAATMVGVRTACRGPLLALAVLCGALAVDDRFRVHEGLSNTTGVSESVFLLSFPVAVLAIAWRWGDRLVPERGWALVSVAGFGLSFALDAVIEEALDLSLPGVAFIEENAKLAGIVALLALVVQLARRALTPPAEAGRT